MILRNIIQRIQSEYSKGVQSSESRLTSRHIYNKFLTVRATLFYQKANKKQKISDWNYQTLNCVELIEIPAHQCPCIPPIGCEVLRSRYKLPRPITGLNAHLIKAVTSITGELIYSEVSLKEKQYKKGNKYTNNKPDYFIEDGYLFITHLKGSARVLKVVLLPDDPTESIKFANYCDDCVDCVECESPLDMDFPIDGDMAEAMILISSEELVEKFNRFGREDITSDSRDDGTTEQVQPQRRTRR